MTLLFVLFVSRFIEKLRFLQSKSINMITGGNNCCATTSHKVDSTVTLLFEVILTFSEKGHICCSQSSY